MSQNQSKVKRAPKPTRIGGLRPSQMIHTFGPGAVVDLPAMSVVVSGIDSWNIHDTAQIAEARLLASIRSLPECGRVSELLSPPWMEESSNSYDHWAYVGVPVFPFPRWLRCTRCDRLAPVDHKIFSLEVNRFRPDRSYWYHDTCRGNKPRVVPTRFMVACANGHLDDFPWVEYVHRGGPCPEGSAVLELKEAGQANWAADVQVTCKTCGAKRLAQEAFGEKAWQHLPQCRGRHLHLQRFDKDCSASPRALLLGASNSWFSIARSALTIPTNAQHAADIAKKVDECWDDLLDIEDRVILDYVINRLQRGQGEQQRRWLLDYDPDEIWANIERRHQQSPTDLEDGDECTDLRGPEWQAFVAPEPLEAEDFKVQTLDVPEGFAGVLDRPIAVDRLREVIALCGFTRIDGPDDAGVATRIAPLWNEPPTWLPAAETRGEGILIRLSELQVQDWEASYEATDCYQQILEAHRGWRARRGLEPKQSEPRARFLLLHSLSHLLIHQVALDCGYSTASIRERLYGRPPNEGDPMAGVLLYTASPDSEGTLGGLVALADPERLATTLRDACKRAELCSTDPMCADHQADSSQDTLHHAACHACMFVPETSCEYGNRYLDRALVVPTLCTSDLAYFC